MEQFSFILSHYAELGLLALISYVFGRRLTWRVSYHSLVEQISFSVGLGLGVIAYLILFLGLLGVLYRSVAAAAIVVGLVSCYPVLGGWVESLAHVRKKLKRLKRYHWFYVIGGIVVLVLLLPAWIFPLYPPAAFDATSYHLASARLYVENHQLVPTPYLRYVVLVQTNQMLFAFALLFADDILAHLIEFLMMATLTAAVFAFGGRHFSSRAGWFSAALVVGSPMMIWVSSVAYVDMGLVFFTTLAVYAFWNWLSTKQEHWLVMAGVFCGLASSTKSQGLFFVGIFGCVTLWLAVKERKVRWPIVFSVAGLLVMAPWLIRNFYYTRNPIFPLLYGMFGRLFGYGIWRPEHHEGFFDYAASYGVGTSLLSLVKLPWLLAFAQEPFQGEAALSPIPLVLLPIAILMSVSNRRIRGLLILVVAYTLFWFFSIQSLRFLAPAIPLLSLVVGASLDAFLRWRPFLEEQSNFRIVTVLGVALLAYPGWKFSVERYNAHLNLPVTQSQRDDYLGRRLSAYPIYKLLNDTNPQGYTLYAMHSENMAYFANGLHMGDWFGPARYDRIQPNLQNGQDLFADLKQRGVNYFLVNQTLHSVGLPLDQPSFKQNFKLLYSRGNVSLYELNKTGQISARDTGRQLLQNPSFEEISDGWPVAWAPVGRPIVDRSGQHSVDGSSAVRCQGSENVFYQIAPVTSGTLYLLGFQARSASGESARARLQISWIDANGTILSTRLQPVTATSAWTKFETTETAPPLTKSAVVYASCHDTRDSVWLDDFSLSELKPGN